MSQSNVEVPPAPPVAAPPPAPTTPVAPAAAPPTPPPAAAAPVATVTAPELPPVPAGAENWLKPRVEQAERSGQNKLLKALGVKDEAEAKALLEKAKAVEEATKTELQKANEKAASFEAKAKRADTLEVAVKAQADAELAHLTEEQRAIVADIIGDDPATIVQKLPKLKASWAAVAPAIAPTTPAPVATTPPVTAAPVTPATTSPPPNAPGGAPSTTPPDYKAEHARLKATNPHAAAHYMLQHGDKIYPRQ